MNVITESQLPYTITVGGLQLTIAAAPQTSIFLPELTQKAAELAAGLRPFVAGFVNAGRLGDLRKIGTHCLLVARSDQAVAPTLFAASLALSEDPAAITGGYATRFTESPANAKAWCVGVLWQVQTALIGAGQPGLV